MRCARISIGFLPALSLLFLTSAIAEGSLNWPTYGQNYANQRYTSSGVINASNVRNLAPAWRITLGTHERVETTPVLVGRTLYVTTGVGDNVIAVDAVTGKQKWRYRPTLGAMALCCGALNRGVAVEGNRVFLATLDARLIALNTESGKPLWSVAVGSAQQGFSETMAPLAADGIVYVGSSGSDYGIRGSTTAYRTSDGKLLWRWYAVSPGWEGSYVTSVQGLTLHRDIAREKRDDAKYRDAWKHGGGAPWITPALDRRTGTLFVSTGNPNPVFNAAVRPGDNLYTDSIVALDAHTGKMRWYYQQTPHDVWEYEAASPPVLFDVRGQDGRRIAAVGEAGKTRWFYVLDRQTGRLIRSIRYAQNDGVYEAPANDSSKMQLPLRGTIGPISYDPARSLAYITSIVRPSANVWEDQLCAVEADTGRVAWTRRLGQSHAGLRGDPVLTGAASTPELVLASDPYGEFYALDPGSGAVRWHYRLGAEGEAADAGAPPIHRLLDRIHDWLAPIKRRLMNQTVENTGTAGVDTSPIVYEVGGREYIAIGYDADPASATGGATLAAFSVPSP